MERLRFWTLAFCISLIALIGCGDDDDQTPSVQSDLIGTWSITSTDSSIEINGMSFVQFLIDALELTQEEAVEFAALIGEGIEIEDFEDFEGVKFTFNVDGTYFITDPTDGDENGTYVVNTDETEVTMTSDGESFVAQIATLTASRLTLVIENEDNSEDFDEDGQVDTIASSVEIQFSKD